MKMKRFGALALSLALAFSLAAVPTQAATFTDVPTDFWGYEEITKMSNQGYAKGYEDGSFKPNGKMTAAETLLFCARATGIDATTQAKIANDRKEEMTQILPEANNMNVWAAAEMAVAVEAGVLTSSELESLSQTDPKTISASRVGEKSYLEETMSRENICMYLVRAMQLEPLAQNLSTYSLAYGDKDDISRSLQPYVYVLTNFGIVKGKETGNFDPNGAVTRAEMTTMLSRALSFMKDAGITAELSEYTTYDWKGGVITNVSTAADGSAILTLNSDISGTQTYSLPTGVKIYDDNMLATASSLKNGQYARLNLNRGGSVREVRLSGTLTTYSGSVSDLTDHQLSLLVGGTAHTLTIDRFTEVGVGKVTGDRSVIDEDAGYTNATCYVDEMGHLAGVKFSGGTQPVEGLVESVTTINGKTTLGVSAFNGTIYRYDIPSGIAITVNGSLGSLTSSHVGKYVQLRVSNETSEAVSVAVDTVSKFVQGPIKRLGTVGTARSLYIVDVFSGKEYTPAPTVSQSAAITYNGELKTVAQIEAGWYVTAMISNNMVVQLDAYPGSVTTEGTLTSIKYGATTVLQVTQNDETVLTYNLDITQLPTINRSGKTSSIDQLRTGDEVVLTVRYNEITRIDATPQTANLTGVVSGISQSLTGATLDVQLSNGDTASYNVGEGVSVTQNGQASSLNALKPGHTVAMVVNGDEVASIEITAAAASSTQLSGTVLTVNTSSNPRTMTLLVTDSTGKSNPVTVNVERGATLKDLNNADFALGNLELGKDAVIAMGAYKDSIFTATILIKL